MDENKIKLIWTAIWLVFILGLCFIVDGMGPLWLLIIWFLGLI
jgi:hypothetical protein